MKNKIPALFLIGIAAMLSACGPSKYMAKSDNMWSMYGYSEQPLDSATYQVTYAGDYTQPPDLVDRYALYRSAELTITKGYSYFVVLDKQADASTYTSTMPGATTSNTSIQHVVDPQTGQMIPVGVTTTSTNYMTTSGTAHTVIKTIRMFTGDRPGDNANAYDAKSMVSMMASSIQR